MFNFQIFFFQETKIVLNAVNNKYGYNDIVPHSSKCNFIRVKIFIAFKQRNGVPISLMYLMKQLNFLS